MSVVESLFLRSGNPPPPPPSADPGHGPTQHLPLRTRPTQHLPSQVMARPNIFLYEPLLWSLESARPKTQLLGLCHFLLETHARPKSQLFGSREGRGLVYNVWRSVHSQAGANYERQGTSTRSDEKIRRAKRAGGILKLLYQRNWYNSFLLIFLFLPGPRAPLARNI